nr:bifunctional demethylmenaquinone methyltransferase/2-methoxy-6-polyprenyl-1,4-benzoquinol methylase UbiE [Ardenticatena sp.]
MSKKAHDLDAMQRALRGERKAKYVNRMFSRIAKRYDLMNRLMTMGRDQAWRRQAVAMADIPPNALVLDLATGTGDLGLAVLEQRPSARVIGADFALPMMLVGKRKLAKHNEKRLQFVAADALQMPFPDNTFDTVLSAFLMRNVEDVHRGFAEQYRVLKPGGRVVCLEITMPQTPGFRQAFEWYFGRLVPIIGGLIAGAPDAYTYLPESVRRFPQPDMLAKMLRAIGFQQVDYRRLMLGTIAIHVGQKPSTE